MGTVWRLQTRTDSKDGKKVSKYYRDEAIAAVGWSINDDQIKAYNALAFDKIKSDRNDIKSKETYYKVLEEYNLFNIKPGKKIVAVETLARIEKGDYIWMRDNGIYYLGYVGNNSKYEYNFSTEALENDSSNQITDINWKPIGDESQVPGAVATAFIRGRTIQRINKGYMFEYAEYAFWGKSLELETSNEDFLQQLFYDCLSPNDCEDLVCLYYRKGYVTIPSTNKIATELYECVLVDPLNGKLAYPQVKKGNIELNSNDYIELIKEHPNKEVYLFTSEGKVQDNTHIENIYSISPDELYSWVKEKIEGNSCLIPEGIVKWYKLILS